MSGDFGRKILEPIIGNFCPVSFTTEKEYNRFIKRLRRKQRKFIYSLAKLMNEKEILQGKDNRHGIEELGGQDIYNDLLEKYELEIGKYIRLLKKFF